jgi:hypothetical protein
MKVGRDDGARTEIRIFSEANDVIHHLSDFLSRHERSYANELKCRH